MFICGMSRAVLVVVVQDRARIEQGVASAMCVLQEAGVVADAKGYSSDSKLKRCGFKFVICARSSDLLRSGLCRLRNHGLRENDRGRTSWQV